MTGVCGVGKSTLSSELSQSMGCTWGDYADIMLEVMYEVPSRLDVTKVVVTRDVILKKDKPLLVTVDAKRKVN